MVWAMKGSSDSLPAANADPTSLVTIESFLDQAEAIRFRKDGTPPQKSDTILGTER